MHALDSLQQIDRTKNIDSWTIRLYFLSRHPGLLALVSLSVVLIGLGVAWLIQKPFLASVGLDFKPQQLEAELAKPKPDLAAVVKMLPKAAHFYFEETPAKDWINSSQLAETEKLVAKAIWDSFAESDGFEPGADLLYYAHYIRPIRYANELIGDYYFLKKDLPRAAQYYRREAAFPDAREAREKLIAASLQQHDKAGVRALANDPAFAREFKPEYQLFFAAQERRWSDLVIPLRELQTKMLKPIPTILAAIAGLAWLLVALQAFQPPRWISFRTIVPLFAVVAGMASTFPTLLSSLWMEEVLRLQQSEDLVDGFLFYMGSVGPREEFIKLAFAVPFLLLALLRKSRLEALMLSGCVGLGFAIWENIQYFADSGSAAAYPRFLTANFFHLALTGLNGLALYDFLRNPRGRGLPLLATLAGTIISHGAYDFLISVPSLPVLAMGSGVVFMLTCLFFFRKLRELRDPTTDQFCIAGTFVLGISILAGTILALAAREIGFAQAVASISITGLATIMVGYMFYWQLGEGLSAEETISRPYAL